MVGEISITPIPVGRPPFPLPRGVAVPFYFTIQPGGAYIDLPKDSTGPKGARLIYPNVNRAPAGARFDFWNYDYKEKGWFVYGLGAVTPHRRSVEPDPGVVLYEFTGAMVAGPGLAPPFGPAPNWQSSIPGVGTSGSGPSNGSGESPSPNDGEPVDLGTGLFVREETDLYLPDVIPIAMTRTYRQGDSISRPFGVGTTHPYEMLLLGDTNPWTYMDLILPDGGHVHFPRISSGSSWTDAIYEHTSTPTTFYKAQVRWNGGGWTLTMRDGTLYVFRDSANVTIPAKAALIRIQDRNGNVLSLTRDGTTGNLTGITSPNGRWIRFTYDANSRITQATDNAGRSVNYSYDVSGRLISVTDPLNGIKRYTYDANNQMVTLQDARGITFLTNQYDGAGRVIKQTLADQTSMYQFTYAVDVNGNVTQVDVTNPRGFVRRVTFNTAGYFSGGYIIVDTHAQGRPEQQTITYARQPGTNLVLGETDTLGRSTGYTYDACGNQTSITRAGVTTGSTFQGGVGVPCLNTFNKTTSFTDPLGHTTTLSYDGQGNVTGLADPLGNMTTISNNAAGQPISVALPSLPALQFGYTAGNLTVGLCTEVDAHRPA